MLPTSLGRRSCLINIEAIACGDPKRAEAASNDTTLRRLDDVTVLPPDQYSVSNTKHDKRQQVSAPESNMQLEKRSSNGGYGAHIDTHVVYLSQISGRPRTASK